MDARNKQLYKEMSFKMYKMGIKVYGDLTEQYYKARTIKGYQFEDNTAEAAKFSEFADKVNKLGENGKWVTPMEMAEIYKDTAYVKKISSIFDEYMDTLEKMREEAKLYSEFIDNKYADD